MALIHILKQNMTDPLQLTLKDKDGNVIDVTGSTITFNMQAADKSQKVTAAAVTVTSATAGEVEYAWAAADTDTVGEFEAEVHEVTSGGKLVIYPQEEYLIIVILEDRKA